MHPHKNLIPAIDAARCGMNGGLVVLTIEAAETILAGIRGDVTEISDLERRLRLAEEQAA